MTPDDVARVTALFDEVATDADTGLNPLVAASDYTARVAFRPAASSR